MQASSPTQAASPLQAFLAPSAIAVIGASPDKTRIRGRLLHVLRQNRYPGQLLLVNPSYDEIDGLRCFPDIAAAAAFHGTAAAAPIDLAPIDLAIVAIPAASVLAQLEACAAAGVRNALVITSGFAEEGGDQRKVQAEIAALARRTGMRVLGPNSEGFYNDRAHVAASFTPTLDIDPDLPRQPPATRRVGIVAQSGGVGFALFDRGRAIGLGFSHVVTTGNEADLTAADFFAHLVEDADTAAVLLFLESVRDPERFVAAAARAASLGKPVIVIKIGRSQGGSRAASSHTASMAGWSAAYDAVFRRWGMIVADDPDQAVAIAATLVSTPKTRGDKAAIITVSGGAGAWVADTLAQAGYHLPELHPATQSAIRAFIPSYGATQNPVDLTAQGAHGDGLPRTIELLMNDDAVDIIVVVTSLAGQTRVTIDPASLKHFVAGQRKPLLFYSYALPSPLGRRVINEIGAVLHTSLASLLASASALLQQSRFVPAPLAVTQPLEEPLRAQLAAAGPLAEHAAKHLLASAGLPISPFRLVRDPSELDATADAIGYPLAIKIQSPDLPHKTEAGGIRLNIRDGAELRRAYNEMLAAVMARAPDARIEGVLIERMARPGIEMIIGVLRDPVFGPILMLGAGGVATELYRDTIYCPARVSERQVLRLLQELRSFPLLEGFRGAPRADIEALAHLAAQLSAFAYAARDVVSEVELNPVIVHPNGAGCTIADALLTITPALSGEAA
jgi:acetate---CoA ligase (ADP-forming)